MIHDCPVVVVVFRNIQAMVEAAELYSTETNRFMHSAVKECTRITSYVIEADQQITSTTDQSKLATFKSVKDNPKF